MPRPLDKKTLDGAAKHYAGQFLKDQEPWPRSRIMQEFFNFTFKDEFEYIVSKVRDHLGGEALVDFDRRSEEIFTPRSEETFETALALKLGIDRDGNKL